MGGTSQFIMAGGVLKGPEPGGMLKGPQPGGMLKGPEPGGVLKGPEPGGVLKGPEPSSCTPVKAFQAQSVFHFPNEEKKTYFVHKTQKLLRIKQIKDRLGNRSTTDGNYF